MEKNEKGVSKFLIALLFILTIISIGLSVYIIFDKNKQLDSGKENQTNEKTEVPKKEEEKVVTVTEAKMQELYDKVQAFQYLETEPPGYFYTKDSITQDTISNEAKVVLAIYNLSRNKGEEQLGNYTKEQVDTSMKSIFGPSVTYQDTNVLIRGEKYEYKNNSYVGSRFGHGGAVSGISKKVISKKQEGKNIIIDEKMVYMELYSNDSNMKYHLYDRVPENVEASASNLKSIGEFIHNGSNTFSIEPYLDKLPIYRYTFSLGDDGNYYFNSIKRI